jgi:hypothetical protein
MIGPNLKGFVVTGPRAASWARFDLADIVVTDLSRTK